MDALADTEPIAEFSPLQKYLAEAIGIFFLVFVGAGTAAMTLIISADASLTPRATPVLVRWAVPVTG